MSASACTSFATSRACLRSRLVADRLLGEFLTAVCRFVRTGPFSVVMIYLSKRRVLFCLWVLEFDFRLTLAQSPRVMAPDKTRVKNSDVLASCRLSRRPSCSLHCDKHETLLRSEFAEPLGHSGTLPSDVADKCRVNALDAPRPVGPNAARSRPPSSRSPFPTDRRRQSRAREGMRRSGQDIEA